MTADVRPDQIPSRRRFDAIVVGSGSGGLTVAVGLGRFGRDVLLVERRHMGGDCTNTGCIPSKALLHETALAADVSGGDGGPAAILSTVRARRDALRDHEVDEFGGAPGVTFVYGTATLEPDRSVSITHRDGTVWRATADDVILATGSSPRRLAIPGLSDDHCPDLVVTNEDLFELSQAPSHLAVIGAGAIGLEMALAFRRLGSQVTVLELADQVLPGSLPEASELVAEALAERGVTVHTGVRVIAYRADDARLEYAPAEVVDGGVDGGVDRVDGTEGTEGTEGVNNVDGVEGFDRLLMAVGRVPNTGGLGLERIGVETDGRGAVVIDGRGRTSVKGVWAVGDMTDRGGTTHQAAIWGRRVIGSIVHPALPVGSEPLRPTVTFTDPEVASIGIQPAEPPDDVIRITVEGSAIDRVYTDRVPRSMLVVDVRTPTGTVVGATVVGPAAAEIITTFSLAMKIGVSFHRWYGTVIPYPTHSELITEAVERYLSETASDVTGHLGRWARGVVQRGRSRLTRT